MPGTRHSFGSANFESLIATGSGGGQGSGVLLVLAVIAILLVVVSLIGRLQQPYVVVLKDPFAFFLKTILFGVLSTVLLVALLAAVIAVGAG
jgi:hypothetical protein